MLLIGLMKFKDVTTTHLPILEEILQIKQAFNNISYCHIYRERNHEANFLSKEGARKAMSDWQVTEHMNGTVQIFPHHSFIDM